jgi:Rieske [2Fe-2S] domain
MQASRSFFDPSLLERHGAAFIREDKIDEALRQLIPSAHVSKGRYVHPATAEPRDLAWNHMDQTHRPFIHRTYGDATRFFIGPTAAFSLTRFGSLPVVLPVFDGYFRDNGFYQVVCLFGLFVIVNVIQCSETAGGTQMEIDWAVASHRLLRFLHPALHRRLHRLNEVQNREDEGMRDRRVELRAGSYRFATDEPDFVNANVRANNVIFPEMRGELSVKLATLREGEVSRIDASQRGFIVRRTGDELEVWPGVCPHEGALLEAAHVGGGKVTCPWHGLDFAARRLAPGAPAITMCGAQLQLSADGTPLVGGAMPGRPA